MNLVASFDPLRERQVILIGGKGGVGKTTLATAAALHFAQTKETILFTTDPASNLADLFTTEPQSPPSEPSSRQPTTDNRQPIETRQPTTDNRQPTETRQPPTANRQPILESLDAPDLYSRFLAQHLASFLEIGDRGTYLDRDELKRLLELSMPGIDELMAWMRIGELAEEHPRAMIVVDTAPTGHTMRMLASSNHFAQLATALDSMQEKHRAMVFQFTRRDARDAMDAFIDDFDARAKARHALLTDPARAAFVPVTLAEPLVIEQTLRLIDDVGMDVPFVVLNRARGETQAVHAQFAPRVVIDAPRACVPLDSVQRIREWSSGEEIHATIASQPAGSRRSGGLEARAPFLFLAGKGGVGKTSCSASIALQLATRNPDRRYVVISVDPAHSLRDLFAKITAPPNLTVETIDTRAKWRRFRDSLGDEIVHAFDALAPRGMSLSHDSEAMRNLIEIAPPGADELFAITRLADLFADETIAGVIVDTAPTGHFLRLLELPRTAGEWVREFMRLLLRYKDLIPTGSLGEELVHASRSLKELDAVLHSDRATVIVVTRPERIVIAETQRLLDELQQRGIAVSAVIANSVTPQSSDSCDQSMRGYELAALDSLPNAIPIERRDTPPLTTDALLALLPTTDNRQPTTGKIEP